MSDLATVSIPRHKVHRTLSSRIWGDSLTVRSFDVTLTIRVSHGELLGDVVDHLPPVWVLATPSAEAHLFSVCVCAGSRRTGLPRVHVYDGDTRIARTDDRAAAILALESALRFSVAETSRQWLFVHAGVVGWRGRAVVIPGISGAGKTSLVRAMVEAGATYYSDEYAVIDEDGLVHPFPKPLSIRRNEFPWRERLPISAIGGRTCNTPIPVGLVIATRYQQHAFWEPKTLTPGETAMALLANTVRARTDPALMLRRLGRAVRAATGVQGDRGEAADTAAAILEEIDKLGDDTSNTAGGDDDATRAPR